MSAATRNSKEALNNTLFFNNIPQKGNLIAKMPIDWSILVQCPPVSRLLGKIQADLSYDSNACCTIIKLVKPASTTKRFLFLAWPRYRTLSYPNTRLTYRKGCSTFARI